jgi:hypothetical protein
MNDLLVWSAQAGTLIWACCACTGTLTHFALSAARLCIRAMLYFEVVWFDCAATAEKIGPAR